jgi:hypothetical protein
MYPCQHVTFVYYDIIGDITVETIEIDDKKKMCPTIVLTVRDNHSV